MPQSKFENLTSLCRSSRAPGLVTFPDPGLSRTFGPGSAWAITCRTSGAETSCGKPISESINYRPVALFGKKITHFTDPATYFGNLTRSGPVSTETSGLFAPKRAVFFNRNKWSLWPEIRSWLPLHSKTLVAMVIATPLPEDKEMVFLTQTGSGTPQCPGRTWEPYSD